MTNHLEKEIMNRTMCSLFVTVIILTVSPLSHAYVLDLTDFLDGLIAYYPLDGGQANDLISGHGGSVHGAVPTVNRWGELDGAMFFDGIQDEIEIANGGDFDLASWTIAAWVFAASTPFDVTGTVVGKTGSSYNYSIQLDANNDMRSQYEPCGLPDRILFSPFNLGSWYLVVSTNDAVSGNHALYIYEDQNLIDAQFMNSTEMPCLTSTPLYIGGCNLNGTNRYFHGAIDDVLIWNRALTAGEVEHLTTHPVPIPTELNSWGNVKNRYRGEAGR